MLCVVFAATIISKVWHALYFGEIGNELLEIGKSIYGGILHVSIIYQHLV